VRRDFLIAWSYRMVFFTDLANLVAQAFLFTFVGKLVNPAAMPSYHGTKATYIEFVAVGIIVGTLLELGLSRVATGIRQEQLQGTLESLLLTPTRTVTVQIGSAIYDLLYVPVRTALFLLMIALAFGAHLRASGVPATILMMLVFVPFVWGLGILSAAGMLTFRRGSGGVNFAAGVLVLGSGAFFPLSVLPRWFQVVAQANPIARSMNAMRDALIGGASWSSLGLDFAILAPASCLMLAVGLFAFERALRRERRRGTLGVY
jgi:ABC-2 type transport system permease protein